MQIVGIVGVPRQLEPPGSEDTLDHTSEGPSCHRNRGHMEAQRGNPEIFI